MAAPMTTAGRVLSTHESVITTIDLAQIHTGPGYYKLAIEWLDNTCFKARIRNKLTSLFDEIWPADPSLASWDKIKRSIKAVCQEHARVIHRSHRSTAFQTRWTHGAHLIQSRTSTKANVPLGSPSLLQRTRIVK
ncbi:hypothetical protein V1514DRAFT_323035 [Lipomyces japonicus]|uniref:uncharacterized protein n=1 Tax=Lipomyces japonicus TaxID=56871 RepID=UPI0034CF7F92